MMKIIDTKSTDPAINLAFEEFFLCNASFDDPILMIWRNEPTVVVGAFQNTYNEVDYDYLKENNIHLIRRSTGGGAVYHDLGNLCFSFIRREENLENLDFHQFLLPVQTAMASLGLNVEISGRNDLLIDGQKVSGSAARVFGDRVLFHGTLLYSSDLSVLGRVLTVKREKIASKGFSSVRSRVTLIADHLAEPLEVLDFRQLLLDAMKQADETQDYEPTAAELSSIMELAEEKYRNDEWIYGKNPSFNISYSKRHKIGELTVKLMVNHSLIESCHFEGDYLGWLDSADVAAALVGIAYDKEAVSSVLRSFDNTNDNPSGSLRLYFGGLTRAEIVATIMGEIS